ncbi:hypothetical protein OHA77_27415 [Streptosporangium sp. NBC_01639]|uniref:hypothetical protein n=1 Tax=Streptosporangium sp. NBC_01639 TaxID=2975948 RepID=UPI0038709F45|nr:hypothetical protein OHA77_27415 [Streptosporangium sp. NBC_01639]
MAEPVRVRSLTDQEGQKLQQIVRRGSTSSVRYRRAMMLPASAGGTEAEQARFFAEVANHVTYPYSPPDRSGDAIAHWALADSWRPPSRGSQRAHPQSRTANGQPGTARPRPDR